MPIAQFTSTGRSVSKKREPAIRTPPRRTVPASNQIAREGENLMARDGASSPALRCELKRDNGVATLRVDGELEEVSAVELARACLHAREASGDVILDLGGIAFADGTGAKMIATMQRVFRRSGHRLTIVNVPARMQREAELLEPDDALRIAS
jgi:anti-anti-sigma factor